MGAHKFHLPASSSFRRLSDWETWLSVRLAHSLTSLGADSEISALVSFSNTVTEFGDNSNLGGKGLILAHETRVRAFRH